MIFVDTWAWAALACRHDQHHAQADGQHRSLQRQGRLYVTTNFVMSEVIAHLYSTLTAPQAQSFVNNVFAATDAGTYRLVDVSRPQFRRAWQM